MKRLETFVDGKLVAPVSSQYMPIINPAHGKPYVEAPLSSTLDVDAACEPAARAFQSWRRVTPGDRSLMLFRIADALEARADDLVEAECRNTGNRVSRCGICDSD